MKSGEQCVMISSQLWMPTWSADSWDTPDTVGFHGLASHKCMHLTCTSVLFVVLFICLFASCYLFEFVKSLRGHLMKHSKNS